MSLNIDLHAHSTCSDGTLSPTALVQRARANGVDVLALTDHDILDGLAEAADAAVMAETEAMGAAGAANALDAVEVLGKTETVGKTRSAGLPEIRWVPGIAQAASRVQDAQASFILIPGVEISITWAGQTIHIVGLRIDPANTALQAGLAANRAGRCERAREIAAELERHGVPDAYAGALRFVGNPNLIARSHFGRYLVAQGICSCQREVFDHWLVEGKPGFVPQRWASLGDAVSWIRGAGGVAVLAHPARYQRLDEARLWALAEDFVSAGGEAIEVVAGGHAPEDIARFARWAKRLGIRASRGSDFHDPAESRFDVGGAPPLPPGLVPVWADWPEVQERLR